MNLLSGKIFINTYITPNDIIPTSVSITPSKIVSKHEVYTLNNYTYFIDYNTDFKLEYPYIEMVFKESDRTSNIKYSIVYDTKTNEIIYFFSNPDYIEYYIENNISLFPKEIIRRVRNNKVYYNKKEISIIDLNENKDKLASAIIRYPDKERRNTIYVNFKNHGVSCYLDSILQMLFNLVVFNNYFILHVFDSIKVTYGIGSGGKILEELSYLCVLYNSQQYTNINARPFYNILELYIERLNNKQEDASEILHYILSDLVIYNNDIGNYYNIEWTEQRVCDQCGLVNQINTTNQMIHLRPLLSEDSDEIIIENNLIAMYQDLIKQRFEPDMQCTDQHYGSMVYTSYKFSKIIFIYMPPDLSGRRKVKFNLIETFNDKVYKLSSFIVYIGNGTFGHYYTVFIKNEKYIVFNDLANVQIYDNIEKINNYENRTTVLVYEILD